MTVVQAADPSPPSLTLVTTARLPLRLSQRVRIYAYRAADLPECFAVVVDGTEFQEGAGLRSVPSVAVYHQDRRADVLAAAFGGESFLTTAVRAIDDHGGILLVYPDRAATDERGRAALPTPSHLLARLAAAGNL